MEEARWFVAAWATISKEPRVAGRCARFRKGDRNLFLSMHYNDFGWFIKMLEVSKGTAKTIVFPEGDDGSGWEKTRANSEGIINISTAAARGRVPSVRDFPPFPQSLPKAVYKGEFETKRRATSHLGLTINIVCPCCEATFEGTLDLKSNPASTKHLRTEAPPAGRRNDGGDGYEVCVGKKQEEAGTRRSDARTEVKARPSTRKEADREFGPARGKGKRPTFKVGLASGRGKVKKPSQRYVRRDSLPAFSGSSVSFSDPILGELCSFVDSAQATNCSKLVVFGEFDPQTVDLVATVDSEEKVSETCPVGSPVGSPRGQDSVEGFLEKEGFPPTDQGDQSSPVGSPLASSRDELALVVFEPTSEEKHVDAPPKGSGTPTELTAEEASKRVLAGIMDFSKILGLSFDGKEDQAANLFSTIENRNLKEYQEMEKKAGPSISRELKRLECGVNYEASAKKGTARGSGKRLDEKG